MHLQAANMLLLIYSEADGDVPCVFCQAHGSSHVTHGEVVGMPVGVGNGLPHQR